MKQIYTLRYAQFFFVMRLIKNARNSHTPSSKICDNTAKYVTTQHNTTQQQQTTMQHDKAQQQHKNNTAQRNTTQQTRTAPFGCRSNAAGGNK